MSRQRGPNVQENARGLAPTYESAGAGGSTGAEYSHQLCPPCPTGRLERSLGPAAHARTPTQLRVVGVVMVVAVAVGVEERETVELLEMVRAEAAAQYQRDLPSRRLLSVVRPYAGQP
jgi:hypothetical protein